MTYSAAYVWSERNTTQVILSDPNPNLLIKSGLAPR